jgi:hypothetical protein
METPDLQPGAARYKAWGKQNSRMDWKWKQTVQYTSKETMELINLEVK